MLAYRPGWKGGLTVHWTATELGDGGNPEEQAHSVRQRGPSEELRRRSVQRLNSVGQVCMSRTYAVLEMLAGAGGAPNHSMVC